MRLNLNCRKAVITKIGTGKYRLVFDISKIKKPRLAPTARLYIEHLHLPEFIDDGWGPSLGNNRGHLELYCENLEEDNIDEEGYGNQTLIYSSPLISFQSFSNSDPMKISNFAINGDFLRDKIVMTLCIYDQYGEPYDKTTNISTELDKTTAPYTNYKTKLNNWTTLSNALPTKVSAKEQRVEDLLKEFKKLQSTSDSLHAEYDAKYKKFIQALDDSIKKSTSDLTIQKYLLFKEQIEDCIDDDWDKISFLLTHATKDSIFGLVTIDQALKDYTNAFYTYVQAFSLTVAKSNDIALLSTSTSKVMINPNIIYDNNNLLDVNRLQDKTVDFEVQETVSGSTTVVATGKVKLDMFMSKKNKTLYAAFVEATTGADKLVTGAKLKLNNVFQFYHPDEFSWIIAQNTNTETPKTTLVRVTSGKFTGPGATRYAFKISRPKKNPSVAATLKYQVELVEDMDHVNFNIGDTLTIDGENFGGNSNNALNITVTEIHEPEDVPYTNVPVEMPPDTGTRDISVLKTFADNKYSTTASSSTTLTKNLKPGDLLKIDGEKLGGISGTHDFIQKVLVVTSEIREQSINITKEIDDPVTAGTKIPNPQFQHSIGNFQISDNAIFQGKVVIANYAGADQVDRKDYVITVSSLNGKYTVQITEPGINFEKHDIIYIDGTVFNGEAGNLAKTATDTAQNDLALIVTAITGSGPKGGIATLEHYDYNAPKSSAYLKTRADPESLWYARCPYNYKLIVQTKIDSNDYFIETDKFEYEPLNQVKKNDTFNIKGSLLYDFNKNPSNASPYDHPQALDGTNDLTFRIDELNPDEDRRQSLMSSTSTVDASLLPRENKNSLITLDITRAKAPREAGPVGRLKLLQTVQNDAEAQEDMGRIKNFTVAGNSQIADTQTGKIQYEKGTDQTALFPSIEIELTENLTSSIESNNIVVSTAYNDVLNAKSLVSNTTESSITEINQTKLKNLNMTLVLYDEIPEYKQASGDAIVGNTYSRLVNNQFKRI
jgi:hypothetical protein